MEANLLLGASTLALGIGASAIALVLYRKNGNGHHKPNPDSRLGDAELHRPLQDGPDWQLERDLAMKHLMDRLDDLPLRMEQAFQQQPREPEIPPEWAARMLGDLDQINEHSIAAEAHLNELEKMNANLTRFTEVVQAVLQMPTAPPPVPGLEDLVYQVQALVNAERRKAAKSPFQPIIPETDPVEAPPQALVPTPPSQPPERVQRQSGPPARAANPVNLEEFNTVAIPQDTIVEMIPPEQHVFSINVMNLGPGTIFLRENAEPILDDPHATKLPPGTGDNGMRAPLRLYALADVGGADISVRLTFGG